MAKVDGYFWLCVVLLAFTLPGSHTEYIPPGPKYPCPKLVQIWPCVCIGASDNGVSLRCEDVSLATLSAAFAYLSYSSIPVEYVHVLNLNTEQLYGTLFDGINITKIRIEDSPIKVIHEDVFYNVRDSLKELEIIQSLISAYPNDAFRELENLESLTLDQHFISNLSEPIKGLQNLKALRISKGQISELSKATFASHGKLTRLDLHGNQLKDIPKDGLMALKNLEFFDLAFNNFTKFEATYFSHLTKLTWFNGSHNELREFPKGTFARNAFLRVIHMTHNKITRLDTTAFRGMRFLRRLYLSDNLIADIGRSTFTSILKVGTIDLARNKLKTLDYQIFSQLVQAEMLDVSDNLIQEVKREAFKDLSLVHINMSHNQISKFDKEAFVNCLNITVLDLSHNQISNFTRGAFDENTYPNEMKLEFNKLKSGGDLPLKFFSGIKILNVSHNELETLSKSMFPKLYELHTLDFSHNNISNIHPAIFTTLFSLRTLNMSHNSMKQLRGSIFGPLSTLISLQFDYNQLISISGSTFTSLPSLQYLTVSHNKLTAGFQIPQSLSELDLSNNEIKSLDGGKTWPVMNALLRLDLSNNQFEDNLELGAFQNLASVQELLLRNNSITKIPQGALSHLRVLQFLDLTQNRIQVLDRAAIGQLHIVLDLRLGENRISHIADKAFDGLLQLRKLDLSRNNLSVISVEAFDGLTGLEKLNLSRNALQKTDNGTNCIFEDNFSLNTIDLSHNQIQGISALTFPHKLWTPYRVTHVDLSHNYITTIAKGILTGTYRLETLNLGFNQINEIRPGILKNLTTLEKLYLNDNHIGNVDLSILGPPPNLMVLDLSNNAIRRFPSNIMSKSPFLELLNLTGNHIHKFDQDFLAKIKNGTRILLNNNSLHCDCRLVVLLRFVNTFRPKLSNFTKEFYQDFLDFECVSSFDTSRAEPRRLLSLSESDLRCDYSVDFNAPIIYQNYDLELRHFVQKGSDVEIVWRVRSKEDVTNFKIFGQDEHENEIFMESFPYNSRSAKLNAIPSNTFSICLRPQYSKINEIRKPPKICQHVDRNSISDGRINSFSYSVVFISFCTVTAMLLRVR